MFAHKNKLWRTVVIMSVLMGSGAAEAADWHLMQPAQITFKLKSLGLSQVKGQFQQYSAKMKYDPAAPESGRVEFELSANSLSFNPPVLKSLILGEEYFYASRYQTVKFASSAFQQIDAHRYQIKGLLSIRGITQPAVFAAIIKPDPNQPKLLNVEAKTLIDRTEFGMKKSLGGVGDKVNIELKGQWKAQ